MQNHNKKDKIQEKSNTAERKTNVKAFTAYTHKKSVRRQKRVIVGSDELYHSQRDKVVRVTHNPSRDDNEK